VLCRNGVNKGGEGGGADLQIYLGCLKTEGHRQRDGGVNYMQKLKIFFSSYPIRGLLNFVARNFANSRIFHMLRSCITFFLDMFNFLLAACKVIRCNSVKSASFKWKRAYHIYLTELSTCNSCLFDLRLQVLHVRRKSKPNTVHFHLAPYSLKIVILGTVT
jgi:hypothetical protein